MGKLNTPRTVSFVARVRNLNFRRLILNAVILVAAIVVGYLGYALLERTVLNPPVDSHRASGKFPIQVEILNGTGQAGVALRWTEYLRARGFDVVETSNYLVDDLPTTLVLDRRGAGSLAEQVAYALGIGKPHILRHVNRDRYVDVSVIIGRDYPAHKPSQ
jgi:hypothetical protein